RPDRLQPVCQGLRLGPAHVLVDERGLTVNPTVKTSLAPGSRVVTEFLKQSGLLEPLEVGQTADALGIRLNRCQLGLFGYGPKAEGRHKIVQPAETVEPGLAQAIRDNLVEGKLPCRAAWDIASALRIPKMDVSAAAEALGIKITRCQLGAF
ncbi:MAG TPA: hypothetical protein EYP52_09005, partial [Anaerolineae bacterium]|nr:hypothetical protein [Anaerolineae bacterium]